MKTKLASTNLRHEEFGSGPAILVIHDGPSNREIGKIFGPLAEAGYRIIVTHLDGLGKKPIDADLPVYSRQVIALLNSLGIGRAVIFGVGCGGIVLLQLLENAPERVAAASLVLSSSMAKQIRELAARPEVSAALKEGHLPALKEELLAILPAAGKEKAALASLTQLRGWVDRFRSRKVYLSAIQHRSALLADMEIPPLIVESENGKESGSRRKPSLAARGWKKIVGVNAHFAALLQFIMPDDEEEEREAFSKR